MNILTILTRGKKGRASLDKGIDDSNDSQNETDEGKDTKRHKNW